MSANLPSTSGRKDLVEQEKQLLGSFWKYVQPMNLYKLLQQRHAISVIVVLADLSRSLSLYSKCNHGIHNRCLCSLQALHAGNLPAQEPDLHPAQVACDT